MKAYRTLYSILIILAVSWLYSSCEEEQFITDPGANLNFSTDTVTFDTVFTNIGSTTKRFTVKNPHNKSIEISSVELARGADSEFRLNINGIQDTKVTNLKIRPKDSLFIFVEVTIDPNNVNNPMVIKDSILFHLNSNRQDVKLIAWGQDVHLINGEILPSQIWTADKPYLVYNSALVDTGQTLEINAGARIHFHKNSALYVAGTLLASGTVDEPVIFEGDRLEDYYKDIPGQWVGIYFTPGSKANRLNHVEIKNAIFGVWADTLASTTTPTLTLSNSKIQHMTSIGIHGRGTTIKADNCVVSDCGDYAVALTLGGSYEFYHCTFGNYWSASTRSTPSVLLNNYYIDNKEQTQLRPLDKAYFGNSIIYGSRPNEIGFDYKKEAALNYTFDHCLLKIDPETNTNNEHYISIIKNKDPKFISAYDSDFRLDTLSPAIDAGKVEIGNVYPYDILNNSRITDQAPDLGAIERVPGQDSTKIQL